MKILLLLQNLKSKYMILIVVLTFAFTGLNAQYKCKYRLDKFDEFTNTNIVATKFNSLVTKMFPLSLLNVMYYIEVCVDMEYTAKDTLFYLFIRFDNNNLGREDEADCINKDNKIMFVLSNKEVITLNATKNYKGKKTDGDIVAGVVTSYKSEVACSYLITKEALNSLMENLVLKCRVEVLSGKEGAENKNYDFDISNNQTIISDQLNCVLQKFKPKADLYE